MPTAYHWDLLITLGSVEGVPDEEQQKIYESGKAYTEAVLRDVFRRIVKPEFDGWRTDDRARCKDSFRYFLTTKDAPFARICATLQESPFPTPPDPYQLFVWLWEELFPGEDFHIDNPEEWKVLEHPD